MKPSNASGSAPATTNPATNTKLVTTPAATTRSTAPPRCAVARQRRHGDGGQAGEGRRLPRQGGQGDADARRGPPGPHRGEERRDEEQHHDGDLSRGPPTA